MMNPNCCGRDARFVNNGRNLQYFFCDECKKEVEHPDPLYYLQTLDDENAEDFFKRLEKTMLQDPPTDLHPISTFLQVNNEHTTTREAMQQYKEMVEQGIKDSVGCLPPATVAKEASKSITNMIDVLKEMKNPGINVDIPQYKPAIPRSANVSSGTYWVSWSGSNILLSYIRQPNHDEFDFIKIEGPDKYYLEGYNWSDFVIMRYEEKAFSTLNHIIFEPAHIIKKRTGYIAPFLGKAAENIRANDIVIFDSITGFVRRADDSD